MALHKNNKNPAFRQIVILVPACTRFRNVLHTPEYGSGILQMLLFEAQEASQVTTEVPSSTLKCLSNCLDIAGVRLERLLCAQSLALALCTSFFRKRLVSETTTTSAEGPHSPGTASTTGLGGQHLRKPPAKLSFLSCSSPKQLQRQPAFAWTDSMPLASCVGCLLLGNVCGTLVKLAKQREG